jgi:hypothetical protein
VRDSSKLDVDVEKVAGFLSLMEGQDGRHKKTLYNIREGRQVMNKIIVMTGLGLFIY